MRFRSLVPVAAIAVSLLTLTTAAANPPIPAASTFETKNLRAIGHSFFPNTPNLPGQVFTANSDLAFRGKLAFQGHYTGFRIVDISDPRKPKQISFTDCFGNQGDIVVWKDILVRSWNSPADRLADRCRQGSRATVSRCPLGFEGLHVFDISDLSESRAHRRGGAQREADGGQGVAERRPRLRLAHLNPRPGQEERPAPALQPDVRRAVPVHLHHRDPARRSGGRKVGCATSRSWRPTPATTPASSSAR